MSTKARRRAAANGQSPKVTRLKDGLSGRCFILRNDDGATLYQGIVHCIVPSARGELVLVQYFEAWFGQPNTMALVPLADMIERPKAQTRAGYVLFEDDQHLRDYMETVQGPRDDRIWKQQFAAEEAA